MDTKPISITLNTKIEELKNLRLISSRTCNVLSRIDKERMEDILNMDMDVLLRTRNSGKRTMFEVESLRNSFSYLINRSDGYIPQSIQTLTDRIVDQIGSQPNDIAKDIRDVYGSDLSAFARAFYNPRDVFERIDLKDYKRNRNVRDTIVRLTRDASEKFGVNESGHEEVENFVNFINSWSKYFEEIDKLNLLDPVIRENLEFKLQNDFSKLAVRTRNCFGNIVDLEFVIRVAFAPEPLNITAYKNCGAKTMKQFREFVDESSAKFTEEVSRLYDAGIDDDIRLEGMKERMHRLYPFLDGNMVAEAAVMAKESGRHPALYLLMRYVQYGSTHASLIYREYFGLGASGKRNSMAQIADALGITQERVRQIRSIRLPLPAPLEILTGDIVNLFTDSVIASEDPVWERLSRENGLTIGTFQLMGLITALNSDYKVLEIDSDHLYLVRKELLDGIKFRTIISKIETILKKQHNDEIEINIDDIILQCTTPGNLNPAMHLLVDILSEYFSKYEVVDFVKDGIIHVKSNKIDKMKGIERVLAEAGRALSFDELLELYHRKYPHYPINNRESFRSYIIRSKEIIPKGKTGIYVLKDWAEHFHGSQTEFIYHLVESSDVPLKLDDLVEKVKKEFPNSSKGSVYTLIYMDRWKRYDIFDGWLIGLKSRNYQGLKLRTPRNTNEFTPEKRLETLKEFIMTNRRFPVSVGKEGEDTLYRWIYNVTNNKINVPIEVKLEVDEILKKETVIPRSSDEANFRDNVEAVISIIDNFNRLPDRHKEPELFKWFKKHSRMRVTYGDRRDIYVNDLHDALKRLGSRA